MFYNPNQFNNNNVSDKSFSINEKNRILKLYLFYLYKDKLKFCVQQL